MLASLNRFHGRSALRRVFQQSRSRRGRLLMVRVRDTTHFPRSRVAVIVAKKTLKSAVKRNRIRRRIYNIVRHDIINDNPSRDIIITVLSSEVMTATQQELTQEIDRLLRPANRS